MNDFFAFFYETVLSYFREPFSVDMYRESQYTTIGITTVFVSLFFFFLFYYIINKPSFSRWYHWAIILILNYVICFLLGYAIPENFFNSFFQGKSIITSNVYFGFALINGLAGIIFYTIFSFLFRWWSTNCKGTPIPY